MDFTWSDEQRMMAETVGRYLSQEYTGNAEPVVEDRAAYSRRQWQAFVDLGCIGALFEEAHGGFGGSAFDIAALFEQLGRGLVIEPFLGTLMAGRILVQARETSDLVAGMIGGTVIAAFAHDEPGKRYGEGVETSARAGASGLTLFGAKSVVPQLGAADRIVVSAIVHGSDSPSLFLVDAQAEGVRRRCFPLIDGGEAGELLLEDAPATLLVENGAAVIADALSVGLLALCWEAVGIMDLLFSDTVTYLGMRRQFGAPLSSFQALRHRIATMAIEIDQARSSVINAAAAMDRDSVERDRAVFAAKYTIGRIGRLIAEEAIQLHGGIGMTRELSLSRFAKRLVMIDHQLGDEDHHLERYMALSALAA